MRINALLARQHEHRILALMLIVLHGAIWWDFAAAASRSLMLAHLGLFLLWQPIWQREERLQASGVAVSVTSILAVVGWLDWWLLTTWLVLLTGMIGGRMTEGRAERSSYMLALIFLISELLIGAIPAMFGVRLAGLVATIGLYGLPALAVLIALIPASQATRQHTQAVDFLYGLTTSLLVTVLAMGSLLRMYDAGVGYPEALFQTTLAIAGFLLAISWLWMPLAGFSGLGQLWTRYLMNIGTPFEGWLARIAALARRVQRADDFLRTAMRELLGLPWVKGVEWQLGEDPPERIGATGTNEFTVHDGDLRVSVHAHARVGAALLLHGRLLIGLLAHFQRAKQREAELTRRAHLEAVYETGARITHDIKNLLQSLYTLTTAMQGVRSGVDQQRLLSLLQRQLPTLAQRLQLALNKLQAPVTEPLHMAPLSHWWRGLRERHENAPVQFTDDLYADPDVPVELFDSVAENLLENALYKAQADKALRIEVQVSTSSGAHVRLSVSDSGAGVPAALGRDLLRAPVASASGLGIGLYQAALQAERLGYQLQAASVADGAVRFELSGPRDPPGASAADGASGADGASVASGAPGQAARDDHGR